MTLDPAIAAAERIEAARRLLTRAQTDTVDLVTLSALELCALGGPGHPLFEEAVARAWGQLGDRRRRKAMDEVTAGLAKRGLLTSDSPHRGPRQSASYSLKPELGIMLAARSRPSAIVVTDIGQPDLRTPRFFVFDDQAEPHSGVVVEQPARLPPDIAGNFRHLRQLGPLGWLYQYFLVSPASAAEILADLTISPPRRSGAVVAPGWTVIARYPGRGNPDGDRLTVHGDGAKARLADASTGNDSLAGPEYDAEALRPVMLRLITGRAR